MIESIMYRKHNLKGRLRKLGLAKLSKFIGYNKVESIHSIMSKKITEGQLAEILMLSRGYQILADKEIRFELLAGLGEEEILYIARGDDNSGELTESDLNIIVKHKWSNKSDISNRILKIFGLDDSYFISNPRKAKFEEIIEPEIKLYDFQKRIKDNLVRSLLSDKEKILIHMPTGSGKTRTTTEALVDFWRIQSNTSDFIVWLADSKELCSQFEETFAKLWKMRGDRDINLIRLWGEQDPVSLQGDGGIIIASLQKVNQMRGSNSDVKFKFLNQMRKRSKVVVVDEAHKSIAPTYKETIASLCEIGKTKLVGLTATPGRTSHEEIAHLVKFYGNNKLTLTDDEGGEIADPISYLQNNEYLSTIERKMVFTGVTIELTNEQRKRLENYLEVPDGVLEELSQNDERNAIIIKEISTLYERGYKMIVFGCSVEHSHLISALLMVSNIPSHCIDGATPDHDRSRYINEFKNGTIRILVNYGVLTTGFDAPDTNAVVITRPTGSLVLYSQMIGRGVRGPKMGGTPDCMLIDLEDNLLGYPSEKKAFKFYDNYWR